MSEKLPVKLDIKWRCPICKKVITYFPLSAMINHLAEHIKKQNETLKWALELIRHLTGEIEKGKEEIR